MIEFRLLWKEKVPELLAMQTFAGIVTTDLATVREECRVCRAGAVRSLH
jgi:hypothetical protein